MDSATCQSTVDRQRPVAPTPLVKGSLSTVHGMSQGGTGPLTGIKVVELAVWIAGPAAALVLADWGADVIKVEPLDGDPNRSFKYLFGGEPETNPVFELDNRGKRGIAVDIRTPEGSAIMEKLIAEADVFVTNLRPAALRRAGLDADTLLERHPSLVYGHITGYGLDGPDAGRAAYDLAAFWSRTGIADSLRTPDGQVPVQRGGMGDHATGMTLAGGIAAALLHRERTGEGQLVSTSLLRQGVYMLGFDLNVALDWGRVAPRVDRRVAPNPMANSYTTRDGRVLWLVGIASDRHFPPLARALGHPEWVDDERFSSERARFKNRAELIAVLDEVFASFDLAEITERFEAEPDVFWAPVNSIEDVIADPQFAPSGALVEVPEASGTGTRPMVASPIDFNRTPWTARRVAPEIGEHTSDVLEELGYDRSAIEGMIASGVISNSPR